MEEIYFFVLRVWGALTSRKGAIVVLLGVVAIVVTVTTVFAAPLNNSEKRDKDPDVFVSMEPPEATKPVVGSSVALGPLDPREELSIGGVSSPGILPTSPFYFVKEIGREFRYAFSFDQSEKAKLKLRYANEDALAIRAMLIEGEYLEAAQQCHSYQQNFFDSLTWAVKLRKEGHNVDALITDLMIAHQGHRLVLADALQVVDECWREAVMGAVTYTSAPFEQVIAWTHGPEEATSFQTKLTNDFSSVDRDIWLRIESRLGLDVEQAIALHEAMGEDSPVGGAPVITSVIADAFVIEPGSTVSITCEATDLAGGELTYTWRARQGELDGNGDATVKWTAPEELGLYTVTVVVSDERGNQSSRSVNLRVGSVEPEEPTPDAEGPFWIEEITAERDPSGRSNISDLPIGTDWRKAERSVFMHSPIRLTCEIGGSTNGLTYEWSADVGEVKGSGDSVVWVAPGYACKAQVTLVVRNSAGASEQATMYFRVSTCAPCFQW